MLCFTQIYTFFAKLKSRTNPVKWITHSFNRFDLSLVSMSLSPSKNSFSSFTFVLAVWYPFISSAASLCGLYPSPPHFSSLPPPTLCDSSAAPCSTSSVQELAASTFCAVNSGLLWSWKFWWNAVVGTKCLRYFSGVPLYLESVQLLIPAVAKYLMI